jgi:mono/diheme cytochrome c family protein
LGISFAPANAAAPSDQDRQAYFETKIRPVLVEQCVECHNEQKHKGGLALDSRAGWERGGDSGPVIVRGKADDSLLIKALRQTDPELKMPRNAPRLDERVIADFVAWVNMGAPDPRGQPVAKSSEKQRAWSETFAERKQWWCFQPIKDPPLPQVRSLKSKVQSLNAGRDRASTFDAEPWMKHPIDRFVLAKLVERGLLPTRPADPRTLIRRLSFAITGLPPTPDEVEMFVRECTKGKNSPLRVPPAALNRLTDRLLASSAFGERWARHWMDLARYAETYGSEHDYLNPYAWRYRDYLIRAFNADLPYDRFVQEQIAGDLIQPRWNSELGLNESLLATAWQRMIESYATPVDVKREEVSVIDWQIESLGKTFLGLTVNCARCHDHKFDPISDEDFYALYGVFASTRPVMTILDDPKRLTARDAELMRLKEELRRALVARWRKDLQPGSLDAALRSADTNANALKPIRELAAAKDFPKAWEALRDKQQTQAKADARFTAFADLTRGSLDGWRVSGPGLPAQPARAGTLSLASSNLIVRAIQPAGYYSDAISERHGGSLRSPEFVLEKSAVSVLASGAGKARLRLTIENFQNDLLLFTGVNPDLESPAPRWFTMRLKQQWIGHRARIELMTRDDKTCVGHARDQREWEKSDGRSAFGIQRVVFHDGNPPPAPSSFPATFWKAEIHSWIEFTERFARTAQAALDSWSAGRASDEDERFLQALLEGGVLSNKPEADPDLAALVAKFRECENSIPRPTRAPGVCDDRYGYDSPLFPRGDHLKPDAPVPRRFLEALGGAPLGQAESGRLALARELTRSSNPLTARVIVNRAWQHLFGRGLVATPDNFGKMGELPTHPELLDHLATKFMADGWSIKRLIHYIVTSQTWQLAAEPPPRAAELDPNNDFLSHGRVRRLEAEAIRDALLAIGGNLKSGHTGPGIRPFYRTQIDPDKQPAPGPIDGDGRRSVYLEARRLFPSEWLAVFDAPKPNILTGRRTETNVPGQSLALLNDPFVHHQAKLFAQRITALPNLTDEQRIQRMYELAFTRPPSAAELQRAAAFVSHAASADDAWRDLAHALFQMKEFIYLR